MVLIGAGNMGGLIDPSYCRLLHLLTTVFKPSWRCWATIYVACEVCDVVLSGIDHARRVKIRRVFAGSHARFPDAFGDLGLRPL